MQCSREPSNKSPFGHGFGNTDPFHKILILFKLISVIQLKVAFLNFFLDKNKVDSGRNLPLSITEGGNRGLIHPISHSQILQHQLQ